jgi:hypothetical protein
MARDGFDVNLKDIAGGTSNLVGSSRGSTAVAAKESVARTAVSNSAAQAVQGIGSLFAQSVDAADAMIKRSIDQSTREQVDGVFDEMGVNAATLIEGTSIDNEPIPSDIMRAEKTIIKNTQAKNQGGLSDNAYWTRVNSISRQLRSRFPGHADYIDQVISKASGGNPQQQIMQNLLEQSNAAGRSQAQQEKERSDFIDRHLAILPADYTNREKYPTLDSLRGQVQPYLAAKEARDNEARAIQVAKERREVTTQMVGDSARATATDMVMKVVGDTSSAAGENYAGVVKAINDISSGRVPGTPQNLEEVSAKFRQFKMNLESSLDLQLTQRYGGNIDAKNREEAMSVAKNMFATLEYALTQKDTGVLNMIANANETYKQGDMRGIRANYPMIRNIEAFRNTAGPEFVTTMMQNNPTLSAPMDKLAVQAATIDMFTNDMSTKDATGKQKALGNTNPQIGFEIVEKAVTALTSPKSNIQMKQKAAQAMFGSRNIGFISGLAPSSKDGVRAQQKIAFNRMVNPQTHKAMVEIRDAGDTGLWDNYVSWTNDTFSSVFKQNADTLVQAAAQNSENFKVIWNGNKFLVEQTEVGAQREATTQGPRGGVPATLNQLRFDVPKNVRVAVENLNGALTSIAPINKDEGTDLDSFVRKLYPQLPTSVFKPLSDTVKGAQGSDTTKGGAEGDRLTSEPIKVQDIPSRLKEIDTMLRNNESDVRLMFKLQQEGDQSAPAATDMLDKLLAEQEALISQFNKYRETYLNAEQSRMKLNASELKGTVQ